MNECFSSSRVEMEGFIYQSTYSATNNERIVTSESVTSGWERAAVVRRSMNDTNDSDTSVNSKNNRILRKTPRPRSEAVRTNGGLLFACHTAFLGPRAVSDSVIPLTSCPC